MKNDKQEIYQLMHDGYYGSGGFLDGGYLTKHQRESSQKYRMRKTLAYYLNYLAPCVNAHISPIFKSLAVRDWKGQGGDYWNSFCENVDFVNTNISDLMKEAALCAKLHGIAYIVMDKLESDGEQDLRMSDLAERNNLPYAYVLEPINVSEVKTDKFGRIEMIKFVEPDAYNEGTTATREMTVDGWKLTDSKGEHSGQWNLGCVPVVALVSKMNKYINPFPPSEFLSIAKTNLEIYNYCSWLSDILANQTFSILTYPSNNPESFTVGTNNALIYSPETSHAPGFIAPPADPANILSAQIQVLQQEIYRMAVVVNVTGSNKLQSGTAKAWDYEATNQILSNFADLVERAENKLAELFKRWTGIEFEYTVNYPNDFKISEVEQVLANAEVAKNLNFGDKFDVEVFKRVLTYYLPEIKSEQFDELVKAYEDVQEQNKLDVEHNTQTDPNEDE